jgi:hypothetical protein
MLFSYLELTVATSVPLGLFCYLSNHAHSVLLNPLQAMSWFRFGAIVLVSSLVVVGVNKRWGWPLRLVMAIAWVLVLFGIGLNDRMVGSITNAASVVYAGLALLLIQRLHSKNTPAAELLPALLFLLPGVVVPGDRTPGKYCLLLRVDQWRNRLDVRLQVGQLLLFRVHQSSIHVQTNYFCRHLIKQVLLLLGWGSLG